MTDDLEEIYRHEAFDFTNPNKVLAVVRGFGSKNWATFHNVDGYGYKAIADLVIRLNGINPSTAAAVVNKLTHFRQYDKIRQDSMRGQLERIAAIPDLDKGVKELVGKALQK